MRLDNKLFNWVILESQIEFGSESDAILPPLLQVSYFLCALLHWLGGPSSLTITQLICPLHGQLSNTVNKRGFQTENLVPM